MCICPSLVHKSLYLCNLEFVGTSSGFESAQDWCSLGWSSSGSVLIFFNFGPFGIYICPNWNSLGPQLDLSLLRIGARPVSARPDRCSSGSDCSSIFQIIIQMGIRRGRGRLKSVSWVPLSRFGINLFGVRWVQFFSNWNPSGPDLVRIAFCVNRSLALEQCSMDCRSSGSVRIGTGYV